MARPPGTGPVAGVLRLTARRETPEAVDDADDPAIWIHPGDASLSLVIGTDKDAGLHVYDLAGREIQFIRGVRPNNVDVRGDVVVAADDSPGSLLVYQVDPSARRLVHLAELPTNVQAHGLCLYRSRAGALYAFANDLRGRVEQWYLTIDVAGRSGGRVVREWRHGTAVEGCVADDAHGVMYLGEERKGIWRYGAEPSDPVDSPVLVDRTGSGGHLTADVEGLAILPGEGGDGLLIASSQGDDHFVAYRRGPAANTFVARFSIEAGDIDGCEDTDGIEIAALRLGPEFPGGLFVCQDGRDERGTNFKFVPLEELGALLH